MNMNRKLYDRIKIVAIKALFSDDYLLRKLVIKGGNAIELIHNIKSRSSIDVDISIENEFSDFKKVKKIITKNIKEEFLKEGFEVFDISFYEVPPVISENMKSFWGGYKLEFKIINKADYEKYKEDIEILRRNAQIIEDPNRRKFVVDFSKFEYCKNKEEAEIEGLTIFVYPIELIIIEKLRAICQQMPEYRKIVRSHSGTGRAKDFFDIYTLCSNHNINFPDKDIIKEVFSAKKVPLRLLGEINKYYDIHYQDYVNLEETVKNKKKLKRFKFYFNYVVNLCDKLKSLWVE